MAAPPNTDGSSTVDSDVPPLADRPKSSLPHMAYSVSNIKTHIPFTLELKNPNLQKWKRLFLITTGKFGLRGFLDGSRGPTGSDDAEWHQLDLLISGWIISTVSDEILDLIIGEERISAELWNMIDGIFHDNKESRAMHLDAQFRSLRNGDLSISEYCQKLKNLADALGEVDNPVSDKALVLQIFRGLPASYKPVTSTFPMRRPFPTFMEVRSRLCLEGEELALADSRASSTALVATPTPQPTHDPTPAAPGSSQHRGQGRNSGSNRGQGRGKGSGRRDQGRRDGRSGRQQQQPGGYPFSPPRGPYPYPFMPAQGYGHPSWFDAHSRGPPPPTPAPSAHFAWGFLSVNLCRVEILTTGMDSFTSPPPPQIQTSASILESPDIFESSLTLETTHYDDGYTDGYKAGASSGKQDGYEVGVRHGFQLGEELGFYKGLVDVWLRALQLDPSCFSSRVQKSVQQMSELLQQYPVHELDHESEGADEMKGNLRLKFRAVCASMGVKLEYNGYPKMSDSVETEF